MVVQPSPLEHLGLICNIHRKKIVAGRVAGRAGVKCAIAPSMPPHVCSRQGRRRLALRFRAAGEVIDFALVVVCGLSNGSVCPR